MSQGNGTRIADARRLLVERVAASSYLNRSARLRDLLHYLAERVLDEDAGEIREHEVGQKVFGRPRDYDTTADNIVRVHASMLRKRLEQYFATEGLDEPVVIEIPKGNYAPVFHERSKTAPLDPSEPATPVAPASPPLWKRVSPLKIAVGLAVLFACSTLFLLTKRPMAAGIAAAKRPSVQLFWSRIFVPGRTTDIVLDDSSVALFEELQGRSISLSEYFDRSYLRTLPGAKGDAEMDAETASTLMLRRQASYSGVSFAWKLTEMPEFASWRQMLRFARDYSFRELKANNSLLVGNGRTNPWIQPFEPKLGIRWQYDKSGGVYFPVDSFNSGKSYQSAAHEGCCSLALLPNLGGTGNVLIVSGTGGSALNAAADFLADERAVSRLRAGLPGSGEFPYFEALIRLGGRSTLPRDSTIVLARAVRK